jgi:hypothetical protein
MSSQSYLFNPTERTLAATGDGFAPPRLTTVGRLALTLGPSDAGMIVYDTTLGTPFWWNGTAWVTFAGGAIYSEGTFSANFLATTGTITLLNPVNNARWSRIGNVVSITGKFTVQSINSPTGELEIDNLPFPVLAGQESAATVAVTGLNNGARTSIMAYMNGSGVVVRHYDSGTMLQMGVHVLAGSVWYLAGTYFTT